MRPYRDIAILAGAQIVCFLLLTHLEPTLFYGILLRWFWDLIPNA
jgi:hypothetical protein